MCISFYVIEHVDGKILTQCSWCLHIIKDGKRIRRCDSILEASHGICIECADKLLAAA